MNALNDKRLTALVAAGAIAAAIAVLCGYGTLSGTVLRGICFVAFPVAGLFWGLTTRRVWLRSTERRRYRFLFWSYAVPFFAAMPTVDLLFAGTLPHFDRLGLKLTAATAAGLTIALIYDFIHKNRQNMRKKIVAGNWKMNTLPAEGVELAKGVAAGRSEVCECVNFIVCPPFTHLAMVAEALKGTDIALGAQDCATETKGAYTGEVAAQMIAALGCKYVILGHSERRQYYGETSGTLNKKMAQAYANGLTPIYCVGENLAEREADKHFDVVKAQIEEVVYNLTEEQFADLVIAYEPVWAIGTGKTATAEQAQEIHAYIRKVLAEKFGAAADACPILYGGSCKPSNAAEIFAKEDVDGGLIGGAALKAEDFLAIGKGFAK